MFFCQSLSDSPYSDFYNENNWKFLEELVIQETCKMISFLKNCDFWKFLYIFRKIS